MKTRTLRLLLSAASVMLLTGSALAQLSSSVIEARAGRFAVDRITEWEPAGDFWTWKSETRHVYDGPKRIESIEYLYDDGTPLSRMAYDDHGQVVWRGYWDMVSSYVPTERYVCSYQYDFASQEYLLQQVTEEHWNGAEWVNHWRETYSIETHASGQMVVVGGLDESWNVGAWTPVFKWTVEEDGGDVVQTTQIKGTTDWINYERFIFPGQTIPGVGDLLIPRGGSGVLSDLLHVRGMEDFDDLGLRFQEVPDVVYQSAVGGIFWDSARRITEAWHVPSGEPATVITENKNWDEWVPERREEFVYEEVDGVFRPLSYSVSLFLGDNQWGLYDAETYAYDANELLVLAVKHHSWQGAGGTLAEVAKIEFGWTATSVRNSDAPAIPQTHTLYPAFPNPFNTETNLTYELSAPVAVKVTVHDVLGRSVRTLVDAQQNTGTYRIGFDATGLTSGLYSVRLETPATSQSRTVLMIK